MALTQEKIISLKKLTALTSGENLNIESVLDSFRSLEHIEIPSHLRVSRSGQGTLLPRQDTVEASSSSSDMLLSCSPQRIIGHQIALGSIMQGE